MTLLSARAGRWCKFLHLGLHVQASRLSASGPAVRRAFPSLRQYQDQMNIFRRLENGVGSSNDSQGIKETVAINEIAGLYSLRHQP